MTFNSGNTKEQGLVVHKDYGSKWIFRPSKKGLYYSDVMNNDGAIMVNTVDSNKPKYFIRHYSSTRKAHNLQGIIGRPSTEDFIKYIKGKMIPNCNITRQDILQAEDIFGPNLGSVKGKTMRQPAQHINLTQTKVPKDILEKYWEVTLAIDIMAINKIPFVITT